MPSPTARGIARAATTSRVAGFIPRRELDTIVGEGGELRTQVTYLQGLGGVGKSELLREIARRQAQLGARVVWTDARLVDADPAQGIAAAAGASSLVEAFGARGRTLLIVDNLESFPEHSPASIWFWEQLVPSLPSSWKLVCAGRWKLRPRWRADARIAGRLAIVPIGNFTEAEALRFLEARRLPARHRQAYFARTHGHPLALAMACELVADPAAFAGEGFRASVGLVQGLLDEFWSGGSATPEQLRALMTCALVRRTSEALVRHVCGDELARPLFEWLRGLSFVEVDADGLFPHDLVRDTLVADLAWRDASLRAELLEKARRFVARELERDPDAAPHIADAVHLLGQLDVWRSRVERRGLELSRIGPASDAEWPAVEEIVRRQQGPASLRWLRFWRERGAQVLAVRGDEALTGMILVLELDRFPRDEAARDPGIAPLFVFLDAHPPGEGARILYYRMWMAAGTHQQPSAELTSILVHAMHQAFVTPRLAFLFSANHEPARWRPLHETPGACFAGTFTTDGQEFGIFGQDARDREPVAWFQEQFGRLSAAVPPPAPLGKEEVHEATRRALRTIDRPDLLRENPLVGSALVRKPPGDDATARLARAEALAELIRGECERFLLSPRDRDLFRVIHRTYFEASGKQRALAEELGFSFITYRRHLASAIRRLADRLWQRQAGAGA